MVNSTTQRFFFSTAKVTKASASSGKYLSSLLIFFSAYSLMESLREIFLQANVNFIVFAPFRNGYRCKGRGGSSLYP